MESSTPSRRSCHLDEFGMPGAPPLPSSEGSLAGGYSMLVDEDDDSGDSVARVSAVEDSELDSAAWCREVIHSGKKCRVADGRIALLMQKTTLGLPGPQPVCQIHLCTSQGLKSNPRSLEYAFYEQTTPSFVTKVQFGRFPSLSPSSLC